MAACRQSPVSALQTKPLGGLPLGARPEFAMVAFYLPNKNRPGGITRPPGRSDRVGLSDWGARSSSCVARFLAHANANSPAKRGVRVGEATCILGRRRATRCRARDVGTKGARGSSWRIPVYPRSGATSVVVDDFEVRAKPDATHAKDLAFYDARTILPSKLTHLVPSISCASSTRSMRRARFRS